MAWGNKDRKGRRGKCAADRQDIMRWVVVERKKGNRKSRISFADQGPGGKKGWLRDNFKFPREAYGRREMEGGQRRRSIWK